jgi:hypothetical protein
MAVNYGLLQPVDIGGQLMAGQQQAQQNQLAQQQAEMRKQEMGMRQQEIGMQADERKLKLDRANQRDKFLTDLSDQMGKGGYKLNRETLSSMMNFGLKSNEDSLVRLATEGLKALDEQDQFKTEMARFAPKAPVTQNVPGALGTGTFDVNAPIAAAAPVNALAPSAPAAPMNSLAPAPVADSSTNAMVSGYTRPEIEQMLVSPNTRVREMGKNLLSALPKQATPKEAVITDVARLLRERDALLPGDPNIAIYNDAIRKATQFAPTASSSTTIKMAPLESSEQKSKGELNVQQYKDVSNAAKLAVKTLPSIDSNLDILNKGFETGFGTETIASAAKVLAALGVPDAEKFATNAQLFQAKASESVLQKQLEQKGVQTQSDRELIEKTGAQLGTTTRGNKFLLNVAREQLKRDIEQRNFYDGWWKKNKTYEGAEDAWFNGEGGKSLFDRPELKQYKEPTKADAAAASARPSLNTIFGRKP